MKTIKIKSLRAIINISLAVLLLNFSCAESGDKSKVNSTNNSETASKIEAPEMDIQMAILTDNIDVVKQHVKAGTYLNKKDAMSGSTPLITASSFGKKNMAKVLIDAGADLSIQSNDGATALHTAAFFCRTEIVQMLIDAKSDKSIRNSFGATPRESVMGPFEQVKPIYVMLQQQLAPMGMQYDLDHIEKTRPIIAEMLK